MLSSLMMLTLKRYTDKHLSLVAVCSVREEQYTLHTSASGAATADIPRLQFAVALHKRLSNRDNFVTTELLLSGQTD
jgi:hypothetical protein